MKSNEIYKNAKFASYTAIFISLSPKFDCNSADI
jgi:hypothetical protein